MRIVNVQQGSSDWLEWRRQGVTASEAVVIAGRNPYKTMWRLWAEKVGYALSIDISNNPHVRRGKEFEDAVRQCMEALLNDVLLPVCVEASHDPMVRASLDGLTANGEPVEMKCPSEPVWQDVLAKGELSEAYQMYSVQVQYQMLATGAKHGFLVFWFDGQIKVFRIDVDMKFLSGLYRRCQEFNDLVLKRQEPPKNPLRDVFLPKGDEEAKRWIYHAEHYRNAAAAIRDLKERIKGLEELQASSLNELKAMMGPFMQAEYGGLLVTRYMQAGRIDYERLIKDQASHLTIQTDAYRAPTAERCRVTVLDTVAHRSIVDEEVVAPLKTMEDHVESAWF